MGGEWREVRLGQLGEVNRGRSRHRPRDAAHLYGGAYPFIQTGDIKASGGRITSHSQTYSEAGLAQSRLWPEGTMVITIAANIAETAILTYPACFPDSVVGFIADKQRADVRFVEYLFRHLRRQIQQENVGTGSVQDNINLQTLARLTLRIPEPREQRRIAYILGTLDDKIENNRKTAKTLEAMAQAIFQSWFVDFDPVRAKMAGGSRESICKRLKLTPEILDLFPDRLVDSELGEIPEGWSYSRLGDVADVNWGNTRVTKKFYVNQGYLAYSATGPDGFLPYYEHDHVGVVVSAIGANSGYTWLALGKWSTIKNTIRFWSDSADMNTEYLYLATHNINFWPLRGSAQPFISQTDARNTKILHPSKNLAKVFGESASKLFQVVHQKERKSQYLIHLRDTLLPKLISGEIRVSDAQAVVDTTANASKLFHDQVMKTVAEQLQTHIRSEMLGDLRKIEGMKNLLGHLAQFNVVVDANIILGDLIWLVDKRKKPEATTELVECIKAGTIVAFASRSVLNEVNKHIATIAASNSLSEEELRREWKAYRKLIKVRTPRKEIVDRYKDGQDPDDAPTIALAEMLRADGILSKDEDIVAMGGLVIEMDFTRHARDYSRKTAVVATIHYSSGMALTVSLALIKNALQVVARFVSWFRTLPAPVQVIIFLAIIAVASNKKVQERVTSMIVSIVPAISGHWPEILDVLAIVGETLAENTIPPPAPTFKASKSPRASQ